MDCTSNQKADYAGGRLWSDRRYNPVHQPILGDFLNSRSRSQMKLGINMLLWTTHVGTEYFSLLARIRQAGFDGVEIPLFEGSEAHFRMVRRALDAEGLACTTSTVATEQ